MKLERIEIVEDRTAQTGCLDGFLKLRRLTVRNHYDDGTSSPEYPCDLVARREADAVAIVLYELRDGAERKSVRVALRHGIRAPAYLRQELPDRQRPEPRYRSLYELVAGLLEPDDLGLEGVKQRAAIEAEEEAGIRLKSADVQLLGASVFASPGITQETFFLAACETGLEDRGEAAGDGSVMEDGASIELHDLREAIKMCRDGRIQDAKTELGLQRLAEQLGYVPQLDLWLEELPAELAARYEALGLTQPGS